MNISIEEMPREIARLEDENERLQDRQYDLQDRIDKAIEELEYYKDKALYDDDIREEVFLEIIGILKGNDKG